LRATMPPANEQAPQAVDPPQNRIPLRLELYNPWAFEEIGAIPVRNEQNPDLQNQAVRLNDIRERARQRRPNRPRAPERP
jgi:hypothetical protein